MINPQIPNGVTWANVLKETPYGTVSVMWKIEEGVFKMDVNIPVGCTANVAVPKNTDKYMMNDKSHKVSELFVEVESGKYSFAWDAPK
jgi:alpha-L-rhamnosidase